MRTRFRLSRRGCPDGAGSRMGRPRANAKMCNCKNPQPSDLFSMQTDNFGQRKLPRITRNKILRAEADRCSYVH